MTVDEYVDALDRELAGQRRARRREETRALREHLGELPPGSLGELGDPCDYARSYRESREFPKRRLPTWWARLPLVGRIALVIVPLFAIGLVAGAIWVTHYQPLEIQVFGTGPDPYFPDFEIAHPEFTNMDVVSYRDGSVYNEMGTFTNHGRFTVTIERLEDDASASMLKFVGYHPFDRYPRGCCIPPKTLRQFPLHVAPGKTIGFSLAFRMTNCEWYQGGGGQGFDSMPLDITVLGVRHRVLLHFPNEVTVSVDGKHPCPRPRRVP